MDPSGEIILTWKDNCNSEDLWIIQYTGPDGKMDSLKMVSTTSEQVGEELKYNFGKGEPGQTYLFWVWCHRTEDYKNYLGEKSVKATVTVPGLPIVGKVITDLVEAMDKVKPEAPSGLTATAVSGSAVTLLWTDNSGNEDGFKVERKAGSGSFEEVATAGADSTSYTDTGLSPGTTYHYRVAAYNNRGSSDYSNEASVNTPGDTPTTGQIEIIFYVNNKTYLVNGQSKVMDAPTVIMESRTLLPIRYVAEPLGAAVKWDPGAEKVTVSLDWKYIELWIGSNVAAVNGQNIFVDPTNPKVTPMILPPGRTMLPLRFIAENLGCQVDWDGTANMAKVTYPKP